MLSIPTFSRAEADKPYVYDQDTKDFFSSAVCAGYAESQKNGERCDTYAVSIPGHDFPAQFCFHHLKNEVARRWAQQFVEVAYREGKLFGLNLRSGVFQPPIGEQRLRFPDNLKISRTYLDGAQFIHCDLRKIFLELDPERRLTLTKFIDCEMSGAKMCVHKLDRVVFDNCELPGSQWGSNIAEDCEFRGVRFEGCSLDVSAFYRVKLERVLFAPRKLNRLTFYGGNWREACFSGPGLRPDSVDIAMPVNVESCELTTDFKQAVDHWRRENLLILAKEDSIRWHQRGGELIEKPDLEPDTAATEELQQLTDDLENRRQWSKRLFFAVEFAGVICASITLSLVAAIAVTLMSIPDRGIISVSVFASSLILWMASTAFDPSGPATDDAAEPILKGIRKPRGLS